LWGEKRSCVLLPRCNDTQIQKNLVCGHVNSKFCLQERIPPTCKSRRNPRMLALRLLHARSLIALLIGVYVSGKVNSLTTLRCYFFSDSVIIWWFSVLVPGSRFQHNERPRQIVCPNSDSVCPNSDKIYLTRVTFKFLFSFHAMRDSSLPSGSWIFPPSRWVENDYWVV
jgi:hypothetical protein